MYASQFDGNAAFSGGGFMPSQTTQSHDSSSTFTTSRNRDAQSLLPLTVKQINDAYNSSDNKSNLIVDGVDVNTVTLVGRVCNKNGMITEVHFVLDDGTGRIECNKWLQEAAESNEVDGIIPVTDFNEIASHFIECIYVHLYNSKLKAAVPNQQHVTNSTPITPTKGYQVLPPNQFSGLHNNGQPRFEEMVLDFLHLPPHSASEGGVSIKLIEEQLRLPKDKLMLAIKNLIDEGQIYEAISDHYKSTING
ncbi:replication protein A 32 kDa subunit B isoform X2 [Arachis hypogaea]|uniref:replication protein A 32 kDa subunit B isoform X2 n=1 Tax=Arachis hypogaea TaxID=3818 RepID=UPI000DEC0E2A